MKKNKMQFPTNGLEFEGNNFLAVFSFVVDDFLRNSFSSEKLEFIFKKSFGDNLSDKDTFSELARAGLIEVTESNRVETRVYYLRAFAIEKPLLLLFKYKEFPVIFDKVKLQIPEIVDRTYRIIRRKPKCSISDELGKEFNRILDLVNNNKTLQVQQLKSEVGYSDGDDAYFNLLQKILGYTKADDNQLFDKGLISTINPNPEDEVEEYLDDNGEDIIEFPEGKDIENKHKSKERNPKLILKAKEIFKKKHGRLFCQVCTFDFSKEYGELGKDYIEGHHTLPVSKMKEDNKSLVKDIALVCANCHRMLHRKRPWLNMDDLKKVLSENTI